MKDRRDHDSNVHWVAYLTQILALGDLLFLGQPYKYSGSPLYIRTYNLVLGALVLGRETCSQVPGQDQHRR